MSEQVAERVAACAWIVGRVGDKFVDGHRGGAEMPGPAEDVSRFRARVAERVLAAGVRAFAGEGGLDRVAVVLGES